jgi:hypothetical protein
MYHVLLQQDASSTAPTLQDPLSPDDPALTRKGTKNLWLFKADEFFFVNFYEFDVCSIHCPRACTVLRVGYRVASAEARRT